MLSKEKAIVALFTSIPWLILMYLQLRYSYRQYLHLSHPYNQCIVMTAAEGRKSGNFLSMKDVHALCKNLAETNVSPISNAITEKIEK